MNTQAGVSTLYRPPLPPNHPIFTLTLFIFYFALTRLWKFDSDPKLVASAAFSPACFCIVSDFDNIESIDMARESAT
jgi:hypothetical protein